MTTNNRCSDLVYPLVVLLTYHREIRIPSRALQDAAGDAAYGEDVLDLVKRADLTVDEGVDALRPLSSRNHCIPSSPLARPDHVHLTVATVRYDAGERRHGG